MRESMRKETHTICHCELKLWFISLSRIPIHLYITIKNNHLTYRLSKNEWDYPKWKATGFTNIDREKVRQIELFLPFQFIWNEENSCKFPEG